jgi:hypothetical protein
VKFFKEMLLKKKTKKEQEIREKRTIQEKMDCKN